jgi:hypothetical protein
VLAAPSGCLRRVLDVSCVCTLCIALCRRKAGGSLDIEYSRMEWSMVQVAEGTLHGVGVETLYTPFSFKRLGNS